MVKSFKFLFQFAWVNLASVLGFAMIVVAGAYATGVPNGAENLFRTYFGSYPFMALVMVFIFAIALCTSNLNMALSFGGRRQDYFWAIQAIMLVYTGVCWALQIVMSAIPVVFQWPEVDRWTVLMSLGTGSSWSYPLLLMSSLCLGCLCGLAFARSRVLGVILFSVAFVAFMAALVLLMLTGNHNGLWGDLPMILFLVTLAVFAVSEGFLWRTVNRYVVR